MDESELRALAGKRVVAAGEVDAVGVALDDRIEPLGERRARLLREKARHRVAAAGDDRACVAHGERFHGGDEQGFRFRNRCFGRTVHRGDGLVDAMLLAGEAKHLRGVFQVSGQRDPHLRVAKKPSGRPSAPTAALAPRSSATRMPATASALLGSAACARRATTSGTPARRTKA
jgi:hypothetical protein